MSRICLASVLAILSLVPVVAGAETQIQHDPLVVTASRLDEDISRMPASVSIITADDIARSPVRTLPELLALEAGVIRRSLYGNLAARDSIDIRGFGATAGQNTLILLDGRRLNDVDLAAVDFSAIPLAAIERIEILRGAGAVLYGDGAVGGAVNIVTKSAARRGSSGHVTALSGSHGTRGAEAGQRESDGSFAANLFAGIIDTNGYRQNNHQGQINLMADFRWFEVAREWYVKLGADNQNLGLPGARTVDPGAGIDELANDRRGTGTPSDYANQDGTSFTAGLFQWLGDGTQLIVDAGYRAKHQSAAYFNAFGGSYLDTQLTTWSLTPRLKKQHTLLGGAGLAVYGLDYYQSEYRSDRAQSADTIATPIHRLHIDQRSTSVYGQDTSSLGSGTTLSAGVRLQRVSLSARDVFDATAPGAGFESQPPDLDTTDTQHAVELGARQEIVKNLSVYGRASRAVRFATVDEVFEYDPNTFARVFSPLKPQVSRGVDLGADYRVGGYKLSVNTYRMNLENEIHFDPNTFTNDNLEPTRRDGGLLSAEGRFAAGVRGKFDYARTRSQFREGLFAGNDVPLVPRDSGALAVSWEFAPTATLSATARYTGRKRFDNDQANTFESIPSYTLLDLGYVHTIGGWKWAAAVQNALNEKAYDYGVRSLFTPGRYNAYPLPERTYSLSLSHRF